MTRPTYERRSPALLVAIALFVGLLMALGLAIRVADGDVGWTLASVLGVLFALGGVIGIHFGPKYPYEDRPSHSLWVILAMFGLFVGSRVGRDIRPVSVATACALAIVVGWAVLGLIGYAIQMHAHQREGSSTEAENE